jgi:hypothetical protein
MADGAGHLYTSYDDGLSWSQPLDGFANPSAVHIC